MPSESDLKLNRALGITLKNAMQLLIGPINKDASYALVVKLPKGENQEQNATLLLSEMHEGSTKALLEEGASMCNDHEPQAH